MFEDFCTGVGTVEVDWASVCVLASMVVFLDGSFSIEVWWLEVGWLGGGNALVDGGGNALVEGRGISVDSRVRFSSS